MTLDSLANKQPQTTPVERLRQLAPSNGVVDRLRFLETLVRDTEVLVIQGGQSQIHTIQSGPHEDRASQIYYITEFSGLVQDTRAEFIYPLDPTKSLDIVQDMF